MSSLFLPNTTRAVSLVLRVKPPSSYLGSTWSKLRVYRLDSRGLSHLTSEESLPARTSKPASPGDTRDPHLTGVGGKDLLFRVNGETYAFTFPSGGPKGVLLSEAMASWNTKGFPAELFLPEESSLKAGVQTSAKGSQQILEFAYTPAALALDFLPGSIYHGTAKDPIVTPHQTEHIVFDPASTNEARYFYRYLGGGMQSEIEPAVVAPTPRKRVLGSVSVLDSHGSPFSGILMHISHDSFYTEDGFVVPANSFTLRTDHEGKAGVHLLPNVRYRFQIPGIGLLCYFRSPPEGDFNMLDPAYADPESNMAVTKPYYGEVSKRTV